MKAKLTAISLLLCIAFANAQYISRSEPVPYNCPSTCAGGTIILKVPQVQNLPNGSTLQALLSNASGSFASGTTVLNSTRYSLNQGSSWINGSFTFTSNINDLYFEITIPVTQPSGSNYTIKMQSSSGYVSNDLFQCNGGNKITVSAGYTPLTSVLPNTQGSNQWIAHVHTWTPNTAQVLSTDQLTAAQDFFNTTNYKGHFLKNSLNFDINYQLNGAVCPGAINILHDGTSIPCSQGYSTNFSIRMLRQENFTPGLYRFEIGADDGIRLSIDGGNTWLLNSFYEQTYAASIKNTDTQYPNGVCLSGNTNLVIEYFQRPVDARLTFTATLLSPTITNPADQSVCESDNATFSTTQISGNTYQWEFSTDGGNTFLPVTNGGNFSGATANSLSVNNIPAGFNGYQFRCVITGICGSPVTTSAATLSVAQGAVINFIPPDTTVCEGSSVNLFVNGSGSSYQWLKNEGAGFQNITDNTTYAGSGTNTLSISNASVSMNGNLYLCTITGCNGQIYSDTIQLLVEGNAAYTAQPVNQSVCDDDSVLFSVGINGTPKQIVWQKSTDGGATFSNIAGSNSQVLVITPVTEAEDGLQVRCVISGCSGEVFSNTALLDICEKDFGIAIPQAFSPNSDGANDYFEVFGNKNEVSKWYIAIYNRWGELVFSSADIDFKWNGMYKDTEQPISTFVYYANATFTNGQKKDYKGNITLMR